MNRIAPSLACILTTAALTVAYSSCGSGSGPHGPCVGGLVLQGKDARLSGYLQANGALDITMHGSVNMQAHAQVSRDSTFSSSATAQGYAIQYSGKVDRQPGAQHKFVISGTFAAKIGADSTTGTFSLRSLDWEVLDGLKAQSNASLSRGSGVPRLTFADDTLGFAALTGITTNLSAPEPFITYFWKTDDAGATWNPMGSLPEGAEDMTFAGQRLWLSTGTGLWSSSDQGQSFVPAINGTGGRDSQYPGFGDDHVLVDFFDADHGALLSSSQSKVWVTQDGGKTWNASGPLNGGAYSFPYSSSVQMLSASEAVALIPASTGAGRSLFRTSDAGASWQEVNPAVTPAAATEPSLFCSGSIAGIRFVDSRKGWAVGQCLATTDDGGLTWTWTSQHLPCNGDGDFLSVSATRAFVSCLLGDLNVTNDGGATFQVVPGVTGRGTGMRVFPDGTGLLVADGNAFITSDGGATWVYFKRIASYTTSVSPISSTEWWAWTPVGLEHARHGGTEAELAVLATAPVYNLRATADTLWGATGSGTWLALPLAGGAPQVVEASTTMWPLSRTTLVAQGDLPPQPGASPLPSTGLSLSGDGGLTWTSIAGLTSSDTSPWNGCVADATHAWFEKGGSFYLFDNDHAQLVLASQAGDSAQGPLFCDAGHFWFDDNGVPKMLSDGAIVAQAAPLEWGEYGTVDSVLASGGAASAISDHAAWILLVGGRLVRFMDDAAYGAYQGPAVLGTAPASATTGTGTSSSRPPTLAPIVGIAHPPRVPITVALRASTPP